MAHARHSHCKTDALVVDGRVTSAAGVIRANYVTNLARTESSGGWSGFNVAVYESLERHFQLSYVGPIAPPEDIVAKISSKVRRLTGAKGAFSFFSPRRLLTIARLTDALVDRSATVDCFHGSTPWIAYTPPVPYSCYLDVNFATYMSVYHDRARFDGADLARIEQQETSWLRGATRVFFSSQWALDAVVSSYGIERDTLRVAGLGGHIPVPAADLYTGGHEFLFIARDFVGKGGHVCVDAFAHVHERFPDATLRIVGERPPSHVCEKPGVFYEGYLRKSVPAELRRLQEILASAFGLVHPTVRDATPQVIVEAQYHGCPTIAPRSFGIPEMVVDGVTGYLVSAPPAVSDVAARMLELLLNADAYAAMRRAARAHALERFTWEQVGDRMARELISALA